MARRALAQNDRAIGLLAEILQGGRGRSDLARDLDVVAAARTLFHVANGVRLSWANGLVSEAACREAIEASVSLIFSGISG